VPVPAEIAETLSWQAFHRFFTIPAKADETPMSDIPADVCRAPDKAASALPTLPRLARLPINRCNLPADILGGLTYQRHPTPLQIDGVADLHKPLWALLTTFPAPASGPGVSRVTWRATFACGNPRMRGFVKGQSGARARASYLRVVRGWAFDSESREAAVLKGWVESRFGLSPRHHGEPLREPGSAAWQRYVEIRAQGLRGTNALEVTARPALRLYAVRTGPAVSAAHASAAVPRRQPARRARDHAGQQAGGEGAAAQQHQFLLALARARRRIR
jgi:hypothetical protein